MCLSSPSIAAPQPQQAPPPPPPAAQNTKPPVLAPQVDQQKAQADLKRKGTQIFRNDTGLGLSIPSSGSRGNGINIPG